MTAWCLNELWNQWIRFWHSEYNTDVNVFSLGKYTMLMYIVNIRGVWVKNTQKFPYYLCNSFVTLKLSPNSIYIFKWKYLKYRWEESRAGSCSIKEELGEVLIRRWHWHKDLFEERDTSCGDLGREKCLKSREQVLVSGVKLEGENNTKPYLWIRVWSRSEKAWVLFLGVGWGGFHLGRQQASWGLWEEKQYNQTLSIFEVFI